MGNRGMNIFSTFCAVVLILQVMQGSCHEICAPLNKSETLTCQSGALLFMERLTFIKRTTNDSNGNCVPDYNTQCGRLQTNNFTGVYLACNKTGTCPIPLHLIPLPGDCGERDSTKVFMEYTCIAATKFNDLCQEIPDASGNDDRLYFSTPDYPRLFPFNTGGLCSCTIRGSKITKVRVLDLNVDDMQEGQTSNFVIENRIHGPLYTKTSRGNTDSPLLIYNEEISQQLSTSFYINFTHGQSSSRLLVEVKGISLAFRCNIHPTTTAETTEKATTTMAAETTEKATTTMAAETTEKATTTMAAETTEKATTTMAAETTEKATTTMAAETTEKATTTTPSNATTATESNETTTAKPATTQANAATANKTATTSANDAATTLESTETRKTPHTMSTVKAFSHSSADESDSSSTSATISSESSVSTESSSLASSTEPVADKILGLELAAFIGVIVGVVVLLLVIIILIAYCVRSKRNDKERKVWLSKIPQHLRIDDAFDSRLTYNNPGYDDTDGKAAYDGNGAVANDYVTGNVARSGDNSSGELKDKEKLENEVIVMENVDYVSQDNCLRSFGKGADAPHCPDERIVHENVEYVSAEDSEGFGNKTGSEVIVLENMEYVSGDDISPQKL